MSLRVPVVLRIALRNLREHKAKTRIIGVLVSLGIAVLVSGNSLIGTAAEGIRRTFIDNFTGDLVITGRMDKEVSLFGVSGNMMVEVVPTLPQYERILSRVLELDGTAQTTPQVTGYALMNFEGKEPIFSMLFGIEPIGYRRMFDSIVIREGRYLQAGEEGILLSRGKVAEIERRCGVRLRIGDPVPLSGFGAQGFKVREPPLTGIFDFTQRSDFLDPLAFIDSQSLRSLLGMTVGTTREIPIGEEESRLLKTDSIESLFGDSMVETAEEPAAAAEASWLRLLKAPQAAGQTTNTGTAFQTGVWHFLLVKLDKPRRREEIIGELNRWFDAEGLAARAIDWKRASAGFGLTADILRLIFSGAILIVAVVAMVIIMNTLVVSVVERTTEIGTMRALGAQKGFVRRMLLVETLSITVLFGLVGIAFGALILFVLNLLRIPATNMFLNALFGGPVLKARLVPSTVLSALGVIALIGVLSHLYPVWIALKIQPIRAIQSE